MKKYPFKVMAIGSLLALIAVITVNCGGKRTENVAEPNVVDSAAVADEPTYDSSPDGEVPEDPGPVEEYEADTIRKTRGQQLPGDQPDN